MHKKHSGALLLIKDNIVDGDKTLEHRPMGKMLGDHFMKYLQGSMFSKFHTYIQWIPDDTGYLDMCWGKANEPVIPTPQDFFGCNSKYMGTIPCSNGWDTIL